MQTVFLSYPWWQCLMLLWSELQQLSQAGMPLCGRQNRPTLQNNNNSINITALMFELRSKPFIEIFPQSSFDHYRIRATYYHFKDLTVQKQIH